MKNKIIQVFLDTDMRFQFKGLIEICDKHKISIEDKEIGEFVVFINRKRNYLKILACNQSPKPVMAAYQTPEKIIDLRIISQIPRAFNASGRFDIDRATEVFVKEKFGVRE